jgi:hypothetical protein
MNNNLLKLNDSSSRILVNLDNVTEMEFKKKLFLIGYVSGKYDELMGPNHNTEKYIADTFDFEFGGMKNEKK